jgi:PAS domain S-box-containing protein
MNEGALTLTRNKIILYANQSFARLVRCPLEQVLGSAFRRFLSTNDRTKLAPLLKRADLSGYKIQVRLKAGDGSQIPVQISIRPLPKSGGDRAIIGMVVTDMTEAGQTAELLRALTHRVVDVLEAERGRVARELHDNITQHLCAILFRCQALLDHLPARDGRSRIGAGKLREMLGKTAEEVERISRDLRPGVLEHLGLAAVLRTSSREFADRTGISVRPVCLPLTARLPADTELALYRIFQEALSNVERHGRARHVTVCLRQRAALVQLVIKDDGIGFEPDPHPTRQKRSAGLGLLSMSERATVVGGTFKIKSIRGAGTEIAVTVPLRPRTATAD